MQSVPAQALIRGRPGLRRRVPARAAVAAAVIALSFLAALALVRPEPSAPPAHAELALVGGLPLQQARCAQWLAASPAERSAALETLRAVVGGPTPFGQAMSLTRAEAGRLFDRTCSMAIGRDFLLYELYTRAAGFRSVAGG